jgi:hypothetical protein
MPNGAQAERRERAERRNGANRNCALDTPASSPARGVCPSPLRRFSALLRCLATSRRSASAPFGICAVRHLRRLASGAVHSLCSSFLSMKL